MPTRHSQHHTRALEKPSREFYEQATAVVEESPSNTVLIDYTLENVEAAIAFGWDANPSA
ncbi:MAG TPA: hypothetical protein VL418_04560 [Devosiaceae bacterium]|nr:hypothetical protein [Devosiaceae bacterium]